MKFILVLTLLASYGANWGDTVVEFQEFDSLTACKTAAVHIEQEAEKAKTYKRQKIGVVAQCFPK